MLAECYELTPGRALGRHYRVVEFLGKGWEGEVYKIEEKSTGIARAAKLFYKNTTSKNHHITYAQKLYKLRDCDIVIQYHHQEVIQIRGETVDCLISDFVDGPVLNQYVAKQRKRAVEPLEALHIFYALVLGIEKIHFFGEYHGDIHSENIIIRRRGLKYEVNLIDLLHLGKTNKQRIQHDIYDLITVLYEILGGQTNYSKMPVYIKNIICGRKHHLITQKFKTASDLRVYLENFTWD